VAGSTRRLLIKALEVCIADALRCIYSNRTNDLF